MRKKHTSLQSWLWADRAQPLERFLLECGETCICGVDEAGRGPLAGPVVAAAVLFRDCECLWRARDSKILNPTLREKLYEDLVRTVPYAVGVSTASEIDSHNILVATLMAMERAVQKLPLRPTVILVDGVQGLRLNIPSYPIRRGDARVAVISAASIVAKVTRDRLMRQYDAQFPGYGFARHFGYPTAEHRAALQQLGPCLIHRRTFHGVRELFEKPTAR